MSSTHKTSIQALEQEFAELRRFEKKVFGGWERRFQDQIHFNLGVIHTNVADNPRAHNPNLGDNAVNTKRSSYINHSVKPEKETSQPAKYDLSVLNEEQQPTTQEAYK
jgi:hypothetical protein